MDLINGIFLSECKRRFLCEVLVDGHIVECYVPSSCKLSNFLDMKDRQVLLRPVHDSTARTQYGLYAVDVDGTRVLVNLAEANRIVENSIHTEIFDFLGKRQEVFREKKIDGYKTDIYIKEEGVVVEVKTCLSLESVGRFPSMQLTRATEQLVKLQKLLKDGYSVYYFIISLNPKTEEIQMDDSYSEFYNTLQTCMDNGLVCKGFNISFSKDGPMIKEEIPIQLSNH